MWGNDESDSIWVGWVKGKSVVGEGDCGSREQSLKGQTGEGYWGCWPSLIIFLLVRGRLWKRKVSVGGSDAAGRVRGHIKRFTKNMFLIK